MAKRGRKTKHPKKIGLQTEETASAAKEGAGGTSTMSATVPMPEKMPSRQTFIRQLLEEDTEIDMEGEVQSSALREMIRKGLEIMMEPKTRSVLQEHLNTPKMVETVKAFEQQMAEEMLRKVFDMVEVMFVELVNKGEVRKDFSISLMPLNKGQGEQQHFPKKMEEWSLDQYKLLITRLTGHVTIVMLSHLHTCKNDLSDDDSILSKAGFTKPVYDLTHNLAVQAANTVDHNKFKDYMKPGCRSMPFCLPGAFTKKNTCPPTSPSRATSKNVSVPPTPLAGAASKKATGPPTPLPGAASGSASKTTSGNQQATASSASRPAQTATKPQSGTAQPPVAAKPAQTPSKPQSGTVQPPASVTRPAQTASKAQSGTAQVPTSVAARPSQTTTKPQVPASVPAKLSKTATKSQSGTVQPPAAVAASPAQTTTKPQVPASVAAKPSQTATKPQSGPTQPPASVVSRSVKQQNALAALMGTTVPLPSMPPRITMMVIHVVLTSILDLTRIGMVPVKDNV